MQCEQEGEVKAMKDKGLLREPLLDCTNMMNVEENESGPITKNNANGQKRKVRMQGARRNQQEVKIKKRQMIVIGKDGEGSRIQKLRHRKLMWPSKWEELKVMDSTHLSLRWRKPA